MPFLALIVIVSTKEEPDSHIKYHKAPPTFYAGHSDGIPERI